MMLHRAIIAAMRGLRGVLAGAALCASAASGAAASSLDLTPTELTSEDVPVATVHAPLDKAISLEAIGPVGRVVVSQPETVQVGQAPGGLYLIGSQPGPTNLLVYDHDGRLTQTVDVHVGYDAQALRELLADALPDEPITVTQLSSTLMLEGEVSRPSVLKIAEQLADRVAPDAVISRLHARSSQVQLEVRILEVSSRALREINTAVRITNGAALTVATGGGAIGIDEPFGVAQAAAHAGRLRLAAAVRGLEDRGELRVMAEPSLVALSGETASFRAGGEFPFPMPQDNKITIEFKPYGTSMKFRPLVQENGLIRVALEAELSDIDPQASLSVAGLRVPGLKTRRATTTADLRDGEAFLIAGLFEETSERVGRGVPFLGKVPVLGPVLNKAVDATRRKDTRQELAILVTPHLSAPVASPLSETAVLNPSEEVFPKPPPSPKATAGLRGPPVRLIVAELKDALRPAVRWIGHGARRVAGALLRRA